MKVKDTFVSEVDIKVIRVLINKMRNLVCIIKTHIMICNYRGFLRESHLN